MTAGAIYEPGHAFEREAVERRLRRLSPGLGSNQYLLRRLGNHRPVQIHRGPQDARMRRVHVAQRLLHHGLNGAQAGKGFDRGDAGLQLGEVGHGREAAALVCRDDSGPDSCLRLLPQVGNQALRLLLVGNELRVLLLSPVGAGYALGQVAGDTLEELALGFLVERHNACSEIFR